MDEDREQLMNRFLTSILVTTELESHISGQFRTEFFQLLSDEVVMHNAFHAWIHGSFSTFEQMLMGCIIQLVKEKNHYKRAVEKGTFSNVPSFIVPIQKENTDDPT